MFRRRRSSSHHQQPLSTSNAQSAQSAASHAFLKSQPSSSSLSSAAAAAALRSLTPTPTPVENVQTKRMIQRRASVASQSSLSGGLRPSSQNALRRANSSSSMSSRTFRDQSPHRPTSSSGPVLIAPPIPSIPREYATRTPPNRRSVSVGPSMRPTSPVKRQPFGRGASVDPDVRGSDQVPEIQRAGSRNSINFSYPMISRPNSPTLASEPLDRRDTSACASIASHLSSADSPKAQKSPPQTANVSARRKTREVVSGSPGRGAQPVDTAVLAAQAAIVPRNDEATYQSSPPRLAAHRDQNARDQASRGPIAYQARDQPVRDQPVHDQHQPRDPARSGHLLEPDHQQPPSRPVLTKRPSTVPEDYQGEERAEAGVPMEGIEPVPVEPSLSETLPIARTPTPEKLKDQLPSSIVSSPESTSSFGPDRESQLPRACQPSSPGRSARFSNQLSVMSIVGEHLHQPPPRSVSPAKSAMKNPRKCSLSPDGRTGVVLRPGPALSELSDGTSVGSDEGSRLGFRRKPVKVSFDDEAEVVGVATSPPTSPEATSFESPPVKSKGRTSWFGMSKKKSAAAGSDEFDEVFKPRPELPSFGSVRRSKDGEHQEPVRQESSDNESTASSEPHVSSSSFSNDHAIGAILSNTQSEDAHAQLKETTSPTPAVVAKRGALTETLGEKGPVLQGDLQNTQGVRPVPLNSLQDEGKQEPNQNLPMPGIAVQPATPEGEKGRSSLDWYTVPGGFPRSSLEFDSTSHDSTRRKDKKQPTGDTAVDITRSNISDDESGESIYSDAEEGLESDVFGSINAVVDEPLSEQHKDVVEVHVTTDDNMRRIEEGPSNLPDIPQTCQIARVVNPVHTLSLSPVPESPASSHERLPYSSPYPPFPVRANSNTNVREIPRSSIATSTENRSILVNGQGDCPVRETTSSIIQGGPLQPQSGNATYQPRHKAGYEQIKKRPASWAPNLLNGVVAGLDDELHANAKSSEPQRPLSNGSDSSSSFKRSNRPRKNSPHTIRQTLRGHSSSPLRTSSPHRTRSPPTNSRPLSSGSGTGTLRVTLRSSDPRREKHAFFSTGKVQRARNARVSGALFSSRFAESDDEQDTSQHRWQSRFGDSSDDEDCVMSKLPPVRGIPRREGAHDGDSTELEDSSDNEQSAPVAKDQATNLKTARNPALAAVAKSRGMSEEEMEEFLRQPNGRRNSLLHRFSIRKPRALSEHRIPRGHPESRNSSLNPDQVHEDLGLNGGRGNTITTITANNIRPASSPRRLRRGISRSSNGDSWPLRSDRKEVDTNAPSSSLYPAGRPRTADGAFRNGSTASNAVDPNTGKADLAGTNATDAMEVGFASGRKKRFPRLRKAFGLRI
ncbi:hypothetical protein BDV23DRAFT_101326 [Aspergillus alliaceus]|uniref:Uncharacterized protein n=1 Tax=Petromyces alliaceus TaxID=209559 RepID=A0A5N7C524_PETAA|nr:hypothetical protein BDV23DRAFT_101326 [Aspergillus alliaceus]